MSDTLVRPPRGTDPDRGPGGDGAEDPRLARRRRAVQAAARHRRNRILAAVAAVVGLVAVAAALTRTPLLDVDRVTVAGNGSVDGARIVQAAGIRVGDPLVDVDVARARRDVMALPGVASARVEVAWPDTVTVRVTPDRPLARLALSGGEVRVARGGRVLGPSPSSGAADLPVLQADAVAARSLRPGSTVPPALLQALVVLEQMPDGLRSLVPTATMERDGSLTFEVADDGGTVSFGPPEEVPAKVLSMATMLGGRVERRCLEVLDVREPSRPTITRIPGCALGAPTVGAAPSPTPSTTLPRGSAPATRKGAAAGGR